MTDMNEDIADYQEDETGDDLYGEASGIVDEAEPEEMQKRVLEMEEELEQLTKLQQQVENQISTASDNMDENSIYIGQVDYEATPEELRAHFAPCGVINRITIMCDKLTGQAKGFAYIEFAEKEAVESALKLDDSLFRGRQLKVLPKRQNIPTVRGGGRFGGRGRHAAPFAGGRSPGFRGSPHRGGGAPQFGGRGAPYRGGGGGRFPAAGRGAGYGGRFSRGRGGRGAAPAYFNSYY